MPLVVAIIRIREQIIEYLLDILRKIVNIYKLAQKTTAKMIDDRDKIRKLPCAACGRPAPSDPAHIKTKGAGGDNSEYNLLPLCRSHHVEQHKMGFDRMCKKFPILRGVLKNKGWLYDEKFRKWTNIQNWVK